MYIIIVYDINQKRVTKALKIARKYLSWVQNSVLEGEITPGNYKHFMQEMKEVLKETEDSLIIYKLQSKKLLNRQQIGINKGNPSPWIIEL